MRNLVRFVGFAFAIVCLYLPFAVKEGGNIFLYGLTTRCVNAMTKIFGNGKLAFIAPVVGKIIAGLLLAVFFVAVTYVLNWALKKLADWIHGHSFTRITDGILAFVLYLVLGIIVCLLVWAIWYLLARYGIFHVDELFTADASLSNGVFNLAGSIIEPLLIKIDQALGVIPA